LQHLPGVTEKKNTTLVSRLSKISPVTGLEWPSGLRFPDFMTMAQDSGRLSALRTGRLYPQEMLLVLISVRC